MQRAAGECPWPVADGQWLPEWDPDLTGLFLHLRGPSGTPPPFLAVCLGMREEGPWPSGSTCLSLPQLALRGGTVVQRRPSIFDSREISTSRPEHVRSVRVPKVLVGRDVLRALTLSWYTCVMSNHQAPKLVMETWTVRLGELGD